MSAGHRVWLRASVSLLAYLAACGSFVVLGGGPLFVRVVAIFAVGLLALRMQRIVRQEFGRRSVPTSQQWLLIVIAAMIGVALIATWIAWRRDGLGFCGLALLYVAAGLALEEVRSRRERPGVFAIVLVGTIGLTLAALVVAAQGYERAWLVAVVGVALAPIGVSLVSEVALRSLRGATVLRSVVLACAGVVLLLVSLVALRHLGVDVAYLAALGGLLVVLMLGIAARSNIDVVFVVVAAAVVWALAHRTVPEPGSLRPGPDDDVVVALGDSFMSGEGAEEFYDGTNTPGVSTCRRAPTAYPALLVREHSTGVPDHLAFHACSGATVAGIRDQVDRLTVQVGMPDEDVAFVLLSVGGNDALFGTIGRACLLPIDCTSLGPAMVDNLAGVGARLDRLYGDLRRALPGVPVVVVPYPEPIAPERCADSAFSGEEHELLHRFARRLNATIARSAERAGFAIVGAMPGALGGMRLCDGSAEDVGVNFLAANSVTGTFEQSLNPTHWVHNSLHPNARGHQAMYGSLVRWLERNDLVPSSPSAVPPSAATEQPATEPSTASGSPCRGETGNALESCASDWMAREAAVWLLTRGWLVAPALVGAWLVALQLVRLWRVVFDDPTPPPSVERNAAPRLGAGLDSGRAMPAFDEAAVGARDVQAGAGEPRPTDEPRSDVLAGRHAPSDGS
jgi:lysophospholipase L1-like esterase